MSLVVDASVIVAALIDGGPDGEWAAQVLREQALAAPHHMPVEAANVLRRAALAAELSPDSASLAHADLLELRIELFSYAPLAERCWQLRENITTYEAAYVALAEQLDAPSPRRTRDSPARQDRDASSPPLSKSATGGTPSATARGRLDAHGSRVDRMHT